MRMRTKTHDAQAQIARTDGPTRLLGLLALLLLPLLAESERAGSSVR